MQRLSKTLVGALLVVWAPQALAANRALRRAKHAYEQLEYDAVAPLLEKALEAESDAAEEVEIYALLATMHVMYGRDAEAAEAFSHVLERQPDFALPADASPKLSAALEAARQQLANRTPEPETEATPAPNDGESDGGETGDTGHDGEGMDPMTRPVPDPISESAPFYSTWWFWTAVGAVVAGAAGTTAVLLSQPRFPETEFGPYDL